MPTLPTFGSISALDTGTGTADRTPAVPSGVAAGSLVLVAVAANAATNGALATNFALARAQTQANASAQLEWKRATGADAGTYSVPHAAGASAASSALALRIEGELTSASPIGQVDSAVATGVATIPTTALTGVTANSKILHVVWAANARTYTPPAGFSRLTANASQRLHVAEMDMPAGGNTGNVNGSMSSTGMIGAILVEIKGEVPIDGNLAGTCPVVTAVMVGAICGLGAGSTAVPTAELNGTYTPPDVPSGDLAGTTPAATGSLTGVLDGLIAAQTPTILAALSGALTGHTDAQTELATADLTGALPADPTGSSPHAVGDFVGTYTPPSEGEGHLAALTPQATADLAGDYGYPAGTLAGTTPNATAAILGSLEATTAGTAPTVTGSLAGSYAEPNPGNLAGATPRPTAALVGVYSEPNPGTIGAIAPGPPSAALVGAIIGHLAGTTPLPTGFFSDTPPHTHVFTIADISREFEMVALSRTTELAELSRSITVEEIT